MVGRAERHEPSKQNHFVNPARWDKPVASSSLGCAQTPSSFPAPSLLVSGEGTVPGEGTEPLGTAASVLFPRQGPRRPGWVTGDFRDSATVIATTDNSAGI